MVKAAQDILRPDGSVIKKGSELSSDLVQEFELSSPQLLDCYITQNAQYFKKDGKKLIPHSKVLEEDLVEVKGTVKVEKKSKSYNAEEAKDLNRDAQEKILKKRKVEFSSKDKEAELIKKIVGSNPK